MSWYVDENPNGVTREHFETAIKLADKCKPERSGKIAPKVGVVVVKNGRPITESYRNQTGSGDHAEFIAFEQRGIDKVDFVGADLITTLEPCTEKRHGEVKKACAEWVKLRRIRKVWIGALDRNPHIRGKAVMLLHDLGIHVGWFPDDLTQKILEQNKEFFEYTKTMTPHLSGDELEERRIEVRDLVQHELSSYKSDFQSMKKLLPTESSELLVPEFNTLEEYTQEKIVRFAQVPLTALQNALSRLMTLDIHNIEDWIGIGSELLLAHEIGLILFRGMENLKTIGSEKFVEVLGSLESHIGITLDNAILSGLIEEPPGIGAAGRAFDTAVKLDGTNVDAVIGLASVELLMGENNRAFEVLEKAHEYISKPNRKVANLYAELGRRLRKVGHSKWRLSYTRAQSFE
jgi:pyrimidine deaminase RibD-like protein